MERVPGVIVITGASAGVGRAVARAYAARGRRLALLARGREGLEGAQRDVEAVGGAALRLAVDVADEAQVESAAQTIEERLGPIDVWINNAMVSVLSPAMQMTGDEYRRVTDVTYLGVVHGTLAALRRMVPRDRGVVVQVGSALAYRGIPLQSAYCAAKHAVQGFTESLRTELLHEGSAARITMVHLPALNTPQFSWVRTRLPRRPQPVPPIFQPELAAAAILWSVDHPWRSEVYVGGSTALAVIGNAIAPTLVDRFLAATGYESQQHNGAVPPDRQDNLWDPLPGDHGAHGEFDERASTGSLQFWLTRHRHWLMVGGGTMVAAALLGRSILPGHLDRT
jgi:NAD(P)-dependent dehydrogenase (short-subunit alcohol dehydrogenase family)